MADGNGADLTGKRIAILATDGYEFSELDTPRVALTAMGAEVSVVAPHDGEIRGWEGDDWMDATPVDMTLEEADEADFDALVLPGGQINPDKLRLEPQAVALVKAFAAAGKPVAAICHGPWLLVEADLVRGREVTSYGSIRTDLVNAGGRWVDRAVAADGGIVTSRAPGDLDAFVAKIAEEVLEGGRARVG